MRTEVRPVSVVVPELQKQMSSIKKRLNSISMSQKNAGLFITVLQKSEDNPEMRKVFENFSSPDRNLTEVLDKVSMGKLSTNITVSDAFEAALVRYSL